MNREIKFRAWDRKSQKMFPVHVMGWGEISNKLDYVRGMDIHDPDSDFHGNVTYGGSVRKMTGNLLKPKFELMQYTGLRDKNGVEIYEGDIVKWGHLREYSRENPMRIAVVKFNPDIQYHTVNGWVFKHGSFAYADTTEQDLEVIGNVFVNPELVGRKLP